MKHKSFYPYSWEMYEWRYECVCGHEWNVWLDRYCREECSKCNLWSYPKEKME